MTLAKANIVEAAAEQNGGYTKKQSVEMVETLLEITQRTLVSGEDLLISGFGSYL
jgi:integration host factor subunit alpha